MGRLPTAQRAGQAAQPARRLRRRTGAVTDRAAAEPTVLQRLGLAGAGRTRLVGGPPRRGGRGGRRRVALVHRARPSRNPPRPVSPWYSLALRLEAEQAERAAARHAPE